MLGLMYQAEDNHKLDKLKKARIYTPPPDEELASLHDVSRLSEGTELSAFQQRFSNMADMEKKSVRKKTVIETDWEEEEAPKEKTLDDLFRELDNDDW